MTKRSQEACDIIDDRYEYCNSFFERVDFKERYDESETIVAHSYVISNHVSLIEIVCLSVNFDINELIHTKKVCECQAKRDMHIVVVESIRI